MFLLSNTKAKSLNMKSPCIFIETNFVGKSQLAIFSKIIKTMNYFSLRRFGNLPSKGYKNQKYPGAIISKYPK